MCVKQKKLHLKHTNDDVSTDVDLHLIQKTGIPCSRLPINCGATCPSHILLPQDKTLCIEAWIWWALWILELKYDLTRSFSGWESNRAAGQIEKLGPDLFSALLLGTDIDAVRVAELQCCPGSLSTLPSMLILLTCCPLATPLCVGMRVLRVYAVVSVSPSNLWLALVCVHNCLCAVCDCVYVLQLLLTASRTISRSLRPQRPKAQGRNVFQWPSGGCQYRHIHRLLYYLSMQYIIISICISLWRKLNFSRWNTHTQASI